MNHLAIINDYDFNLEKVEHQTDPEVRIGARGIIFNDKGKIAVFFKQHKNEHKLPGGGVDENEEPEAAFLRECLEEIGYNVEITKKLGTIMEDKTKENFQQISHVFVAKTISQTDRKLTEQESDEGATFNWLTIDEALEKMNYSLNNLVASKYDDVYRSKFMVLRDIKILEYYKKNIE